MPITTLFTDLGGVLLTNGWDRDAREAAARNFGLDPKEMDERHRQSFDAYESGKITLSQYLRLVLFYRERNFSEQQFREFMFAQSKSFPEMIELVRGVKARHKLKVGVISNEGRELTEYRVRTFQLAGFVDFFVSSCFVHLRKPDPDIFRLALDLAQVAPAEAAYLEDRPLFVEVAASLGMHSIHHTDYPSTVAKLAELGLKAE